MRYLADTNILLRFVDRMQPHHAVVQAAVRKLLSRGDRVQATSQNFVEFWNVATRPATRNGFGLTSHETDRRLRILERLFPLLPDGPGVYPEWRRLVVTFNVSGVQVHDARLIAAMRVAGVTHILTLNTADFGRYEPEGIVAIDPAHV